MTQQADHEALVRQAALAICKSVTCEGSACCQWPANMGRVKCNAKLGYYDPAALTALAIVAQTLETVTPGMFEARRLSDPLRPLAQWRAMLAASPLLPGKGEKG